MTAACETRDVIEKTEDWEGTLNYKMLSVGDGGIVCIHAHIDVHKCTSIYVSVRKCQKQWKWL